MWWAHSSIASMCWQKRLTKRICNTCCCISMLHTTSSKNEGQRTFFRRAFRSAIALSYRSSRSPVFKAITTCQPHTDSKCYDSKNAPTLSSCSFDKHGLILITLVNNISTLLKMIYVFNFPCPFTFTYFICF